MNAKSPGLRAHVASLIIRMRALVEHERQNVPFEPDEHGKRVRSANADYLEREASALASALDEEQSP